MNRTRKQQCCQYYAYVHSYEERSLDANCFLTRDVTSAHASQAFELQPRLKERTNKYEKHKKHLSQRALPNFSKNNDLNAPTLESGTQKKN